MGDQKCSYIPIKWGSEYNYKIVSLSLNWFEDVHYVVRILVMFLHTIPSLDILDFTSGGWLSKA